MSVTINNVTANNQITIIFDAGVNPNSPNDGPRNYSGNTEADVIIDGQAYLNIQASDQIPSNIHAFQYSVGSNTGEVEYVNTDPNLVINGQSEIPSWVNIMITRWNGEKTYEETYNTTYNDLVANLDASSETYETDLANAHTSAQTSATTAKNNILGA